MAEREFFMSLCPYKLQRLERYKEINASRL